MNSPTISDPETETRVCEKHGEYAARVLRVPFSDAPIRSACPECAEERTREQENFKREQEERRQNEYRRQRLANCALPLRFADKTIAQFEPPCTEAQRIKTLAERFVAGFDPARGTSLIFCGKPGTGKTHIACAIARAITDSTSAHFSTVLAAIRHIKGAYRKDCEYTEDEALESFISPSLLVLDEIGVQVGSEHEKMLLFEIINERYQRRRSTILISNLTAEELAAYLGDRVVDRFREDGAVIAFDWDSHRGRK